MKTGYIYKLVCKDVDVIECYVGSTDNTRIRKSHHKSDCNNEKSLRYNYRVYQYIRDSGGFLNWDLIVLETFQYNEKYELKSRERHHIERLGSKLNAQIPNRTSAEYYQDNLEHIKDRQKQYQADNKEHIKDHQKQYRADNLEHIKDHQKQYYQENKEHIKDHQKQYYQENKEKIAEQFSQTHICECGKTYTTYHKSRHNKSKTHTDYIAQ